jgi:hypothetical protein
MGPLAAHFHRDSLAPQKKRRYIIALYDDKLFLQSNHGVTEQ